MKIPFKNYRLLKSGEFAKDGDICIYSDGRSDEEWEWVEGIANEEISEDGLCGGYKVIRQLNIDFLKIP